MTIQDNINKYFEASLLGAGRGLVALPLEHPLDVVKTRAQAHLDIKSPWRIATNIYQSNGWQGFYSGAIPNGIRLATKQMYRYPMMIGFPVFFEKAFPLNFSKKFIDAIPIATALSIASFEAFIISPFERFKVFLITSDTKSKKIREFFALNQGRIRSELFRGTKAVYVRQVITWASFLVSDKRVKDWEKNRLQTTQLSFASLMRVSFVVGLINTASNMPFDVVKTALQKRDYLPNDTILNLLRKVYRAHGVRGLYAGWQPRIIQYMLQSAFTVTLIDHLEKSWRK